MLGTIMQPQAAGEQAVAVGDVDDVLSSGPGGVQRSGRALGPHVDVVPGIPHHRLFAGGAGGGMDTDQLALRHGEETKGIVVAQIGLDGERQIRHIIDGMDVPGRQPYLIKFLPIKRDVFIGVPDHPDQAGGLNGMEVIPGGTFHLRLVDWHTNGSFLSSNTAWTGLP